MVPLALACAYFESAWSPKHLLLFLAITGTGSTALTLLWLIGEYAMTLNSDVLYDAASHAAATLSMAEDRRKENNEM
jgi:hypothetical protein